MYKIYKHTMPDGKCYIGQTKQEHLYRRWQYGMGYSTNKAFFQDIVQVGWNNITHEVLEEVATKSEAMERERYYILQYRSNEPEYGYNTHSNIHSLPKAKNYIKCVETGELFENMAAAAARIGRTRAAVSYAILHNTSCAKLHWQRVQMTEDEYRQSKQK